MKKIAPVTMYPCPETGELFASPALARANARKIQQVKEQEAAELLAEEERNANNEAISDSFRLELDDIRNFSALLEKKVAFHFSAPKFKINLNNIRFGMHDCSHSCPVGKETNWCSSRTDVPSHYLGWRVSINGTCGGAKVKGKEVTIGAICRGGSYFSDHHPKFGGFRGLNTGSGGFGDKFYGDMTLWLDDFPILKDKYKEFEKLIAKEKIYAQKQVKELNRVDEFVANSAEIKTIEAAIESAQAVVKQLEAESDAAATRIRKSETVKINPDYNVNELAALKANF
jgi:hypothetical protein